MEDFGPQPAADDTLPDAGRPARRLIIRWRGGVFVLLSSLTATLAAVGFAPDATFRVMALLYIAGITGMALIGWWLFLSGIPWRARVVSLLLAVILVAAAAAVSVRGIYFDGDMRPRIRWKWETDPAAQLQDWLTSNPPPVQVLGAAAAEFRVTERDWPRYCGHDGARVIREPRPEVLDWQYSPPSELWRHPTGAAWSSFAVVGDRIFTQEQRGPLECTVCYDANSGTEIWCHTDPARYETAMGGTGPRATPTVTSAGLYALGATGILSCLQPETGRLIWQRNILTDAGSSILDWGMSGSPLVLGNRVIVDAGGDQDRAVIAYETSTGEIVWATQNHRAGYAAPRLEQFSDTLQLLIFHGDGLLSLNPENGMKLWEYPWTNLYHINVAQPIRVGEQLLISSGYDAGCVLLDPGDLTDGRPREVWPPAKSLKLKFNEAVLRDRFVYGLDDGILTCIDAWTGERKWKGGRYRFGQILLWDDLLLIQAEKGFVAIVEASPAAWNELTRFDALSEHTWNVPVVSGGRLFVRNAQEAACFRVLPAPAPAVQPVH